MKKITVLVAFLSIAFLSQAQCDKTIKWTCSKQDFFDTAGNFRNIQNETVEVITTPAKISITRNDGEQTMEGDVTDLTCNWKDKQNGKTVFKSVLLDSKENKTRHATITIEAVNGKTTILLRAEEEETMIKLDIDSFEEVKQ
jgi:ribosome biogenesis protein Tsr3